MDQPLESRGFGRVCERARGLEKEVAQLKQKLASGSGRDLAADAVEVKGVKLLATKIDGADAAAMRNTVDQLKNKLKSGVFLLSSVAEDQKVVLIAGVTPDLTKRVKAGDLVNFVAQQVGGRGGGRPDLAQAGGNQPERLDGALASVAAWLSEQIG